jgi:hypothetical protein
MRRTRELFNRKAAEAGIDPQGVISSDQLLSIRIDPPADGETWSGWRFDRRELTLTFENGYWVDLETLSTSASLLDWIFQVFRKTWCTPKCLSGLIEALEELLSPQQTLCCFGAEHTIHPKTEILKRSQ